MPVRLSTFLWKYTHFGQTRKTMFGLNWEYDFTKNFQLSGTIPAPLRTGTDHQSIHGSEPLKNTLWGINNWRKESQWLTNVLDKTAADILYRRICPAHVAGEAGGTQDNASYIDDFEGTKTTIDVTIILFFPVCLR